MVTGTDTGVGKTYVSQAILRALEGGVGIKPVETGCSEPPSDQEDGALLAAVSAPGGPPRALQRFAMPAAPPVAAEVEGRSVDFEGWLAQIRAQRSRYTLVEGAGGLLSPLSWKHTALDLATRLSAEAVVVAADKLGTLNHTLMTLRVLEQAKVPVLGVVLSAPEHEDPTTGTNARALRTVHPQCRVLELPRAPQPKAHHLSQLAALIGASP